MRGLTSFVTDIRYCQNEEDIQKRVAKELAKIRSKFASGVKGYDLKKYIWKIIYIFMLGFDVEFGYMEAVQLVAASKYSEKNAVSVFALFVRFLIFESIRVTLHVP